ncbi:sulfide quinone oxidoreductase isoform X2 [Arctopsyche grandis]|uniref:sulfide quinone oxidoreductase isoform X2 n=1 Tax=Arctopsyche grandis TaxID=121162 RepID=UPI00406D825C
MNMNSVLRVFKSKRYSSPALRQFSMSSTRYDNHSCKFLVIGGGTAGCAISSKISNSYGSDGVIVLEPNNLHYYQPLFTLIGAGIKKLDSSHKEMKSVLPKKAKWIKDSVAVFEPEANKVTSNEGHTINYEYMIISTGLQLNFNAIPGLEEALNDDDSKVCSIYSPKYVTKTWTSMKDLNGGNLIFTYPNSPVKCPGAPQKIMYLAEDYFRNVSNRNDVNITYNSSLGVIFGVKKYADALWKIVKKRDINVNLRRNLIEVKPDTSEAVFQNLDNLDEKFTVKYDLLHVTPPMGPSKALLNAKSVTNASGFVEVNKSTMQHVKFPNIFALGDCTDSPNSKTAAAAAAQSCVVEKNLKSLLNKKSLDAVYDGYASCPLVTSRNRCVLAEFDYSLNPMETFPFNQAKERLSMYIMKKDAMPLLYWNVMTKGYWNGPEIMRKIFNPFKFN